MSDITVKLLKLISEDKTLNEISEILKLSQKQIFNYLIYPVYSLKTTYMNLEYSATKITANKIPADIAFIT